MDLRNLALQSSFIRFYWGTAVHSVQTSQHENARLWHSGPYGGLKSQQYEAVFAVDGAYSRLRERLTQRKQV
jgi:2-polyprenyl-6-methoxyphenol hydroxylase-like FAD-dependent oxidoreductase